MLDIEGILNELIGDEKTWEEVFKREFEKHWAKEHFIPIKYRLLGGYLQSLNIKFGIFLELLMAGVLSGLNFEVIEEVSRQKIPLELEEECERLIDDHINVPLKGEEEIRRELPRKLEHLFQHLFDLQNRDEGKWRRRVLDVNLLFKRGSIYYYMEVKYNDDHDTGKYMDINRKFLKTYAGLIHKYRFKNRQEFRPILYYFNPYRRYYPSPYLRDGVEVFRGKEIFDELGFSGGLC